MRLSGISYVAQNRSETVYQNGGKSEGKKEFKNCLNETLSSRVTGEEPAKPYETMSKFEDRLTGKKGAPYSYLADDSGMIEYKGVVFFCDDERNTISLGDVSNPKNVITIPLSGGGCLKVNRDNIDDLSKAISMFCPEDINRILRALSKDAKAQKALQEIEEEKDKFCNSLG
ncbi:MAG: hypothetical protein HDR01_01355 [Lachnospiraceae bacterium]|nr:hypothetical protein [Lachnospiraceae bacterium]